MMYLIRKLLLGFAILAFMPVVDVSAQIETERDSSFAPMVTADLDTEDTITPGECDHHCTGSCDISCSGKCPNCASVGFFIEPRLLPHREASRMDDFFATDSHDTPHLDQLIDPPISAPSGL